MDESIDWSRLTLLKNTRFANIEHQLETTKLAQAATDYLRRQQWCQSVGDVYLGLSEAGLIGIFLCQTFFSGDEIKWLWVIVGDIPSLYISPKYARNQYQALNSYLGEVDAWASSIESGTKDDTLASLDYPADTQSIKSLLHKLDVLDHHILGPARHLLS